MTTFTVPAGTRLVIKQGYAAWYEQNCAPFAGLLDDGEAIVTDAESFEDDGEHYAAIHTEDRSVGCYRFPLRFALTPAGRSALEGTGS